VPGPSDAQDAVESFRARINKQGDFASGMMVQAYAPVYTRLERDTRALVGIAQTRGLKPWQVMRMERLKDLERQFLANTSRFATQAGSIITDSQLVAVGLGRDGALEAASAGLPRGVTMQNMANLGLGWNQLPDDAFQNFVGISADGAPLANLLEPLGPQAVLGVREQIGTGIALGKGPRETANLVRTAAGIPLSRALLITRTETNRAFREATRLSYQTNSQVVKGYRRHADKSDRTCAACIALDGEFYPLDQPLNEHPNGRCALVPDVLDYADLGLDIPREAPPQNAREWLAEQGEETQRRVLGGARYDAWRAGEVELNQLAIVRPNAVWGDTAVVRPLNQIQTRSGTPIRQVGAPPSALKPTPPKPVTGDLIDPMTGKGVRGSRTAPPEPTLPKEWEERFGDPDDFLDVAPIDADPAMLKYRGATGREAIQAQVQEQEAWARAVGGATEADYTGLSIKAARDVNIAIEKTILRNRIRPLDKIVTGPYRNQYGEVAEFGNNTMAYQIHGNVHINLDLPGANGSVRGWRAKALNSQQRVAEQAKEAQQSLAKMDEEIATARAVIQNDIERRRTWLEVESKKLKSDGTPLWTPKEISVRQDLLEHDMRILASREKKWKKMLTDHRKEMREIESGQWAVYHGKAATETTLTDLVTHEIGHYAHRRYGYFDPTSLDTLATKTKVYKTVRGRKVWAQSYKPKQDARKISEYATTNDHEYFAEAWADYHANNGARLTPKVKAFIEEVIEANANFTEVASGPEAHKIHLGALNRVRRRSGADAAKNLIGHPRLGEL
tara:strand:+ start:1527 stop:3896 length:2370 start_codon:yes stop_codon:yes gene_type:complete